MDANVQLVLINEGRFIDFTGKMRAKRRVHIDRKWAVERDGIVLGYVVYRMWTHERRNGLRRIVESRWQSPGWGYGSLHGREFETYTKHQAIERVIQNAEG